MKVDIKINERNHDQLFDSVVVCPGATRLTRSDQNEATPEGAVIYKIKKLGVS